VVPNGTSEIIIQPFSPFYPHDTAAAAGVDGQPLGIRYRCTICGNRVWDDKTDAWQIVAGVKGTAWSWDWDGSFNYSANKAVEQGVSGMHLNTLVVPLMNTIVNTTFNPFGPSLPGAAEAIQATEYHGKSQDSKLDGYGIDLKGSGEIFQLPAGPLALAVGLQAGKSTLNQKFDPNLLDVDHYGATFFDIDQSRKVWAVYGELNVPIYAGLEAIGQLRYDHYSDFGSTTNPKVALRWQAAKWLLFRGSYGTGFAAPTLYQLWTPQSPGLTPTGQRDPLRCTTVNEANPDCNTQYVATFGGNPNLDPAKSKTWQVGGVVEPVKGLQIGADWVWLDLKNLVGNGIPYATILDPALYSTYAFLVTRAATCQPSAFVPGAPCPITAIDQTFVNQGEIKIQAIDVNVEYRAPMTDFGQFTFGFQGTYYNKWDYQNPDGTFSGYVSNAFQNPFSTGGGYIPRWKWYAPINWSYGPWSATLANNYISSYIDVGVGADGNTRRVGSLSLWDLQGVYAGFKDLKLTLGAKNLFDKNPGITNSNLNFQKGYDPSIYDARARFIYGSVNYAFK
jgi:iron complex outermembrane receptor protein